MVTCGSRGHVAARGCSRPPRAVGLQRKGPQWALRAGPTERRGTDSGDVPERYATDACPGVFSQVPLCGHLPFGRFTGERG